MIRNYMKTNVISIQATASLAEAAQLFVSRHVGLLPVVDQDDKPIGSLALRDLVSLALPAFVQMMQGFDFVKDFGAVEALRPSAQMLRQRVTTRMGPAFTVPDNCGLLRAYALMHDHNLHDLPVVNAEGKLVGIASRVDLGTAILSTWQTSQERSP